MAKKKISKLKTVKDFEHQTAEMTNLSTGHVHKIDCNQFATNWLEFCTLHGAVQKIGDDTNLLDGSERDTAITNMITAMIAGDEVRLKRAKAETVSDKDVTESSAIDETEKALLVELLAKVKAGKSKPVS